MEMRVNRRKPALPGLGSFCFPAAVDPPPTFLGRESSAPQDFLARARVLRVTAISLCIRRQVRVIGTRHESRAR